MRDRPIAAPRDAAKRHWEGNGADLADLFQAYRERGDTRTASLFRLDQVAVMWPGLGPVPKRHLRNGFNARLEEIS